MKLISNLITCLLSGKFQNVASGLLTFNSRLFAYRNIARIGNPIKLICNGAKISIAPLLSCFMLLFSSNNIFAQDTESDSAFYQKVLFNAMDVYHQSFGNQSALFNGNKYYEYPFRFKEGFPFFYSPSPVFGSVLYEGILYDSVLMQYQEITDELVIFGEADWIRLLSGKVERFNLFNSEFIRLEKDSLTNSLEKSGFYNLLYKGKIWLLKKQIKNIREVIWGNVELQRFADEKDYYYIKEDDRIYRINSKENLFKLFEDRKKEVQQFIKANKLSFRKDRQNMLTKVSAYYDSLKK